MKHTPTPWVYDPDCHGLFQVEGGIDGKQVADINTDEVNAAFIVRACNAHEELVKALKAIAPFVKGMELAQTNRAAQEKAKRAAQMVIVALAKAEGN